MRGTLLDRHGRTERAELLGPSGLPTHVEANLANGWAMPQIDAGAEERRKLDFSRLPQHVLDNLEKSGRADFSKASPFMASSQGWRQLEGVITGDTVITAAAEAIMVPDFLLAVPRLGQQMTGVTYKYTLFGEISAAVTTPGTFTYRMRWGGVAGVLLAASAAIAPTGTQVITTVATRLEYWVTIRTVPTLTTATSWCQGEINCPGFFETTPASTTIMVALLKSFMIPQSGPAVSPSIDVSVAKALSPTYQPSLGTASMTTHLGFVESLN